MPKRGSKKSDELLTKSKFNQFVKDDFDILKNDFKILRSDFDILKSDFKLLRSDFNILKSDFEILRSDFDILKSDFNILRDDFDNFVKNDFANLKKNVIVLQKDFTEFQSYVVEKFDQVDARFDEMAEQNYRNIGAIMENNDNNTKRLIEAFNGKFEIIERKIDSMRQEYRNWLSNHEIRITKLEKAA